MSVKSSDVVSRQLDAIPADEYIVGFLRYGTNSAPDSMFRRFWSRDDVIKSVGWMSLQNLSDSRNINFVPKGEHAYSLIDDLTPVKITEMKATGFEPACVVQTSPNNYHVWVNHGAVLPVPLSTQAAKQLAKQFGGDPGAATSAHLGRLAGFTNRKAKHRLQNGLFPFCRLIESSGRVYSKAAEFIDTCQTRMVALNKQREEVRLAMEALGPNIGELHTIDYFRGKFPDGHVADLSFTLHALQRGVSQQDVEAAIRTRDLSKKGCDHQQQNYIDRTIKTARRSLGASVSGLHQ